MEKLIRFFIRYPVSGDTLLVLICIFGLFGLRGLKTTFFPEVESRIIAIQVVYPGASPEEMEQGVTLKIEDNLKGITGIERVTSVSSENSANIDVEVYKGFSTDRALQDVKNAVDRISSFPVGMEPPVVFKRENLNFAINFAISGKVDLLELKRYAKKVEQDLRAVDGISKVSISGYPDEEIEIALSEAKMKAYALSFDQVSQAVRRANIEITGGTVKGAKEELLIRARSKEYFAEKLGDITVQAFADGRVVRLSDVAELNDKWADNPNRSYFNNNPSVVINIQNTTSEDLVWIAEYINNYIVKFNDEHTDVQATVIRDGSITVTQRRDLLVRNGLIGLGLVLLLLSVFLNHRIALWVALSIPISFLGMFMLAGMFGLTINVITLFGMILVIGILVDDGIVIAENIYQKHEEGYPPLRAAVEGTMEVLPAVFSAILTTMIAFSLFFFLEGGIGDFISQMAIVVILTLGFSLIEGVFILPSHIAHSKALRKNEMPGRWEKFVARLMSRLRDKTFAPILAFSLKNKAFTVSLVVGLFLIVIGMVQGGVIKTTFFPFIDRDNVDVTLSMPAGTRAETTERWLARIEDAAWHINDSIKKTRADGKDVLRHIEKNVGPAHQGRLNLILLDGEARAMESFLISNPIRKSVGPIPGAESVSYGTLTFFGKPVSISLLSNNPEQLTAAKTELGKALKSINSLKDVIDTDKDGLREVHVSLKEKARLLGLTEQEILSQVRQGFFGNEVQRLQRGTDEVRVWVRYPESERASVTNLQDMYIRTAQGNQYPLRELANLDIRRGILSINHLDGMRVVTIEADLADQNESASDIMQYVKDNEIAPLLAKFPQVAVSYEGQSRNTAKTGASAARAMPIILILLFSIIVITFRSFAQAIIVLVFTVPLGLIGVGLGHLIHGSPISILSAYGIIALIGVMVNDALVLISAMNANLKQGMVFKDAIHKASLSRFRPILLTSITTIAGLAPLILEGSLQAKFLIPMAISVAYGMMAATVVTLIILPVVLSAWNDFKVFVHWYWNDKNVTAESVEPAVQELKAEQADA